MACYANDHSKIRDLFDAFLVSFKPSLKARFQIETIQARI